MSEFCLQRMLPQYHQIAQEERVVVAADVCNFVLITTSNTIKIYHRHGALLFQQKSHVISKNIYVEWSC